MQYPPVPLAPSCSPSFHPRGPTNHGRPIKAVKFRPSVSHGTFVPSVYIARRTRERERERERGEGGRERERGKEGGTWWRGAVYQRKLLTRSLGRPSALKWLRWEAMNRRSNGSFLFLFRHPRAADADAAAIAVSPTDATLGPKDRQTNERRQRQRVNCCNAP